MRRTSIISIGDSVCLEHPGNTEDLLRDLYVNPYVNIVLTGDQSRGLLVSYWGFRPSGCPNAYSYGVGAGVEAGTPKITLWNVAARTENTGRLFFSDDIEYVIIFYDSATTQRVSSLVHYVQYARSYCSPDHIVVILCGGGLDTEAQYCSDSGLHLIRDEGQLGRVRTLACDLADLCYKERVAAAETKFTEILDRSL